MSPKRETNSALLCEPCAERGAVRVRNPRLVAERHGPPLNGLRQNLRGIFADAVERIEHHAFRRLRPFERLMGRLGGVAHHAMLCHDLADSGVRDTAGMWRLRCRACPVDRHDQRKGSDRQGPGDACRRITRIHAVEKMPDHPARQHNQRDNEP